MFESIFLAFAIWHLQHHRVLPFLWPLGCCQTLVQRVKQSHFLGCPCLDHEHGSTRKPKLKLYRFDHPLYKTRTVFCATGQLKLLKATAWNFCARILRTMSRNICSSCVSMHLERWKVKTLFSDVFHLWFVYTLLLQRPSLHFQLLFQALYIGTQLGQLPLSERPVGISTRLERMDEDPFRKKIIHLSPEAISILNVINVLTHTDLSRKCLPLILGMLLAKHNYKTSAILHKRERIPHSKLLIFPVHLHPLSAITLAYFLCEASPKSQESDHSKLAKK